MPKVRLSTVTHGALPLKGQLRAGKHFGIPLDPLMLRLRRLPGSRLRGQLPMPLCLCAVRLPYLVSPCRRLHYCLGRSSRRSVRRRTTRSPRWLTGLDKPWSIAAIDNGAFLITEKSGRLVRLDADGHITAIGGTPEVYFANQGGLLEVLPDPAFTTNRTIYLSFASGDKSANRTTVVKATLNGDALTNSETILEVQPDKEGPAHYGGKLAFLPDGTLLVSVGEGYKYREEAQNLDWELGKLLRINTDGSAPADNPFPEQAPRVFSYGHRNPQGLLYDTHTQRILMMEHGPKGGDELNHVVAGARITAGLRLPMALTTAAR